MQFRQSRANDRTLRWDVIDEIIATDVLRTFVQTGNIATTSSIPITCYRCRRTGHIAAQCFTNMGDNQGGGTRRNYYRPIDTTHNNIRHNMVPRLGSNNFRNSMAPFRLPQRWGDRSTACHAYNAMGRCGRDCSRPHRCASCNGAHPRFSCHNNTITTTTTTTTATTATTTTTNKDNHDVSHEREDTIALYELFNPLPNHPITPIDINKLSELLVGHPDKGAVQIITDGLTHGFDIGYRGTYSSTRPRNLRSAREHAAAVSIAIRKELDRGHTAGPFRAPPFAHTHCSPIGAVEKTDGSYSLILDLSSPRREAVNEGIDREEFSMTYSHFDDAVDIVRELGMGSHMAKIDIKHAFRICPVEKAQWPLLCYTWQDAFFVDTRLPFGSRSSPYIFNALADLLMWILLFVAGIRHCIHYLDDYFSTAATEDQCKQDMQTMSSTFTELAVPLAPEKIRPDQEDHILRHTDRHRVHDDQPPNREIQQTHGAASVLGKAT